MFPFYLSIGMTAEQYWDGDASLPRYYRKAEEMRTERRNQELWLQGMYIYEALCCVAPLQHAFAKKGTKPHPYTNQPYPITSHERQRKEEDARKHNDDKAKQFMESFMLGNNKKFAAMRKDEISTERK